MGKRSERRAADRAERKRALAAEVADLQRRQAAEDARRAEIAEQRQREMREGLPSLAGDDAGPFCPQCKGRQFEARRDIGKSIAGAISLGVGAFLVPRDSVECVTCGARYRRG